MVNWKNGLYLALIFSLWGCGPESYMVDVGFTNGSTTGEHGVTNMSITSESGGKASFAMGAISSYPGAHSSGGRMDAPIYYGCDEVKKGDSILRYH
ncbi:hypothetical protein ACODG7_15465 [Vibrio anguillarum]|uniref:hypothetical protein n=1 Tax=Vibrio TaxID=662 RepID=UPI001372CF93|nr:hypothetical protein [Vibrio sp. V23_P3S9T160]NAW97680.1 hypothetical protein [Vibrio sp. V23_P3S9T160]